MTQAWEFEEPEAVEASHLVRTRCHGCGGVCLADPAQARRARCSVCLDVDRAAVGSTAVGGGYTIPVGYPNPYGATERAEGGAERESYPAPAVVSRDGVEPADWPGPVLALEAEARRLGWSAQHGYARGRFANLATGAPLAERESFSVRFWREDWQGYAVYVAGVWKSIFVAGKTLAPFGMLGRKGLTVWLTNPAQPTSWYDTIRRIKAAQAEDSKVKAAARPKKAKSDGM